MEPANKIDMEIFKVVHRALALSDNIEIMADHLTQILVATLNIKGAALFALNVETDELEVLGGFGLSTAYVNKGPVMFHKSVWEERREQPLVIPDISRTDLLQYPQDAKKEGIGAMVSLPVVFHNRIIGMLRLYHGGTWEISPQDLDYLMLLAADTGLAMMYMRMLNSVQEVREAVNSVHPVWLAPA